MNSKILIGVSLAFIAIVGAITIFAGITQMDFEDKSKKVTQSPPSLYEDIHGFSSDSLGNYQKWCEENRGVWYDGNNCGFVHHKDVLRADAILEDLKSIVNSYESKV